MAIQFVQRGASIDYRPSSDVAAGVGVVRKYLFGVTRAPIKAGDLGALDIEGVFELSKPTGAGAAFVTGDYVLFDTATQQARPLGMGGTAFIGRAVADAGESDPTVRVKLLY